MNTATRLRGVRFLIRHRGTVRSLFKVGFAATDGSLYMWPYSASGRFYFGQTGIGAHESSVTFDFTDQFSSDAAGPPKVSIHESGQVHVKSETGNLAGPLFIPALSQLRGQHVATVQCDSFAGRPAYPKRLRRGPPESDQVLDVDDGAENGRVAIYVNGRESRFDGQCPIRIRMVRPTLSAPLYVGLLPVGQALLGDSPDGRGVSVIAGWDPSQRKSPARSDFLFVRGT